MFRGAVVVGTLRRTTGICSAVDTLRVGATMIAFIVTIEIGAGGVSGSLPTGCAGIARGSRGGWCDASRWNPDGSVIFVAPSTKMVAIWWRA